MPALTEAPRLHWASTFTSFCSYQMSHFNSCAKHLSEGEYKCSAAFKKWEHVCGVTREEVLQASSGNPVNSTFDFPVVVFAVPFPFCSSGRLIVRDSSQPPQPCLTDHGVSSFSSTDDFQCLVVKEMKLKHKGILRVQKHSPLSHC
ncbi:hypothetical protein EXN66_Car010496 [Channa argus]|uniref:Uncharacterized protein n=1 Tax=Channa argus TaxID=215402 RepID=A0A6G1PWW9_CHAAH|nr:hypothetical protein EXN66_Car010496 [Channa argus]